MLDTVTLMTIANAKVFHTMQKSPPKITLKNCPAASEKKKAAAKSIVGKHLPSFIVSSNRSGTLMRRNQSMHGGRVSRD